MREEHIKHISDFVDYSNLFLYFHFPFQFDLSHDTNAPCIPLKKKARGTFVYILAYNPAIILNQ